MTNSNDDKLIFAEETQEQKDSINAYWNLLIVDDEPDVHATTKLVLGDFEFEGRKLNFLSAYTAKEAETVLRERNDIALTFLDVVMETNHAGLDLADIIRNDIGNRFIRIILRTGQPGEAPEKKVIAEYDINDYKNKAELTSQQLYTCVYSALRSYRDLMVIDKNREGLSQIIDATANLFKRHNVEQLAQGVLTQVMSLLGLENSYYLRTSGFTAAQTGEDEFTIIAATGRFEICDNGRMDDCRPIPQDVQDYLKEAVTTEKSGFYGKHYIGYFPTMKDRIHLLFVENCKESDSSTVENLLTIFSHNAGIAFDNVVLNKEIRDTQIDIIYRLGEIVESRSKETAYHVKRVAEFTYAIARSMGLSEDEAELYKMSSPMHDIGKIGIPDAILMKPAILTDEERNIMRTHTTIGYNMLKASNRPLLKTSAIIARDHHEFWNGSGYPRGISGNEIHLSARIVCLADIFDALSSRRVYKEPWEEQDVIDFIHKNTGIIFDPDVSEAFFKVYKKIKEIQSQYKDA